jgi:chromosome segregation ATPase
LRELSERASVVANALGTRAAEMAECANQMSDMEAANKVVDQSKLRVDRLESAIRQICEANSTKCTDLSGVLARFPAPTDHNGVEQDMAAWTRKLAGWANELASVQIADRELREQVEAFKQGWQDLGAAMSRLVTILEVSKKYEQLNREFNTQVEHANDVIARTNATCQNK